MTVVVGYAEKRLCSYIETDCCAAQLVPLQALGEDGLHVALVAIVAHVARAGACLGIAGSTSTAGAPLGSAGSSQGINTRGALLEGAVGSAKAGITVAARGALGVPGGIVHGAGVLGSDTVGTVVGTHLTLASSSGISGSADALASGTVAASAVS